MIPADEVLKDDDSSARRRAKRRAADAADSQQGVRLDPVAEAVAAIGRGESVVVVDDEDRENEGDLIFAAAKASPSVVAFMIRYTSGVVCVPLPGPELDRLDLPPMTSVNEDRKGTAYTVSVDARDGVSTGISAAWIFPAATAGSGWTTRRSCGSRPT